mmetsp:Transcript_48421/g.54886  ORF Transcript_48421/g.54886 Transcript_48421/m.54886 type:complete len:163 (+) Transcript_48421:13-501(+)
MMMMRFSSVPILISSLFYVYVMTSSSSSDVVLVDAFGVLSNSNNNRKSTTQMMMIDEGSEDVSTTRKNFLIAAFAGGMTVATVVAPPDAAWAAKEISAIQKRDNYLSTFVYECTKPKGEEQKSRVECISEGKAAYKASLKPKVVEPEAAVAPAAPTQPASSE